VGKLQIPAREIRKQTTTVHTLNFHYKYFVTSGENWEQWEDCNNRHISVILLGSDQITVRDIWNIVCYPPSRLFPLLHVVSIQFYQRLRSLFLSLFLSSFYEGFGGISNHTSSSPRSHKTRISILTTI
jgi:hypothetical protein